MKEKTSPPVPQQTPGTGYRAYTEALARYPVAWYERKKYLAGLILALGTTGWWAQRQLGLFPNPWLSLASVLAYIFGWTYDTYETHTAVLMKKHFDKVGLEFPWIESALFLPKHPTLKEQILSLSTIMVLLLVASSFFLPSLGFAAGIGHLLAGYTNLRWKKRLQLAMKSLGL